MNTTVSLHPSRTGNLVPMPSPIERGPGEGKKRHPGSEVTVQVGLSSVVFTFLQFAG